MRIMSLTAVIYHTQLTDLSTFHLNPRNTHQSDYRCPNVIVLVFSGFNSLSASLVRMGEHDRISSHPVWYLFGRQPYIGTKHVTERCSYLLSQENNPVKLTTSDFELVFRRPAKKSVRIGEYCLLYGRRVEKV